MIKRDARRWMIGVLPLLGACGPDPAGSDAGDTTSATTDNDPASTSAPMSGPADDTPDDSGSAATTIDPADDTGMASTDDGPSMSEGCGAASLAVGEYFDLELMHDGELRTYEVLVPDTYDPDTPMPLVVNFHGYTSNANQQKWFSGIEPIAQAHGFIVAHPEGIQNSWNGGLCCGDSASSDRDDVGFARALVEEIAAQLCVDRRRVYAMGMSNGGYMSHRLACEAADVFTAIGPVAGVIGIPMDSCTPARPISVLHVHGTEDSLVPYDGGGLMFVPSVMETMAGWAARNGCEPTSEITFEQDDVRCETWPGCDAGVEVSLCTIVGGGHCWPGTQLCPFGTSTTTIHASEEIATFFEKFALP